MIQPKTRSLLLMAVCLAWTTFSHANSSFLLSSDPYPPLIYERNGKVIGDAVTYLEKILNKVGIQNFNANILPWKRVLYNAELGDSDIIGPMLVDHNKSYLLFSEAFFIGKIQFWHLSNRKSDKKPQITDTNKRYGVVLGYTYEPKINEHLDKAPRNVTFFKDDEAALKSLADGRIDYFIGLDVVTRFNIQKLTREGTIKNSIAAVAEPINTVPYVFGISKKSKLTEKLHLINLEIQKTPFAFSAESK